LERVQGVRLKLRRLYLYYLKANSYQLSDVFVFPSPLERGQGVRLKLHRLYLY